ncbi:MAG: choline dehydrogenase-like flavoprotein, partial [Devosia sp.]|uniref:GMC family oxidoreductase n=1 Tax=Devosia sp. TaxID=1871048 RepID=UPI0026376E48
IEPLRDNPLLTLKLNAGVNRILVENERAIGVIYRGLDGAEHTAQASGDIILSAGALVSPKLLMLSGIGPGDELRKHGIPVAADLPGVGQNLMDHPEVPLIATFNGPFGYHGHGDGWRMIQHGLHFKLFGGGKILSAGVEAGAFVNPLDPEAEPSIQAFCVPDIYLDRDVLNAVEKTHGVTITTVVTKPKSRGFVKLRSPNPADMPIVSPNLLQHPDDMATMIAGQRLFIRAFENGPLGERIARIVKPDPTDLSDEALVTHCKRLVKTNYHPAGTARMGADGDPMAVLDAQLRVRGIANLRVADMSACPNINAGNTAAPAMMIGDRCASFIQDTALASQEREDLRVA